MRSGFFGFAPSRRPCERKYLPSKSVFSCVSAWRISATDSRTWPSGARKSTPFQSRMIAWEEVPRPRMKRSPESCASVAAVIASTAGVRL
jgi:hypothetical protein